MHKAYPGQPSSLVIWLYNNDLALNCVIIQAFIHGDMDGLGSLLPSSAAKQWVKSLIHLRGLPHCAR